jgi:hypothetical protein
MVESTYIIRNGGLRLFVIYSYYNYGLDFQLNPRFYSNEYGEKPWT